MLDLLVAGSWLALGIYSFWYFCKAKTCQPLAPEVIIWTWKLHKRETGCNATRMPEVITKDGKPIGFKCECGYKFIQRRPITQRAPAPSSSSS